MMILGMVIATIILVLSMFIGPYGIFFFFILLFGLAFSIYHKNNQIHKDILQIKEKLGLLSDDEIMVRDIKRDLDQYSKSKKDPQLLSKLNQDIEDELELIVATDDGVNKNDRE